jgi:ribose/xylose/arabinose/galactoside ABC-type transport system permease subunit
MSVVAERIAVLRHRLSYFPEAVAFSSLLFLAIFFSISAPNFLTAPSIGNILTFGAITGIVTIGIAMLMVAGEFDLSVGSNFGLASYIVALSLIGGMPVGYAILLALVCCTLLGALNGLIVTKTGIPSFIATLGTLLAYRGIVRAVGKGNFATYKGEPIPFLNFLNGDFGFLNRIFGVEAFRNSLIWFVILAILFSFILMRTRFGNWVFAAGGNADAASAQGVNVPLVKITCFALAGLLAAFASVLQFSYRLSVDPLRGDGLELIVVAASVIGGIRMTGGYGTIIGAVAGTFLLQMLDQGLVLMQIPIQVFQATVGLIIIISVISNTYLGRGD